MGTVRRLLALGALTLAAVTALVPPRAEAQTGPGTQLVELCATTGVIEVPELGPRTCASFDAGSVLFAAVCGQLPLPAAACADLTDGRTIDTSVIDDFEGTWVHRALRLQERLDRGEPLRNSFVPHTHNSYNATAYAPAVSNIDPNQRYTVLDQLRMGIRGIELDLHWVPSTSGSVETGGMGVVLCHGTSVDTGALVVHLGCSVDRAFVEGLREIRAFLDRPGNDDVVLLLYLENQLDGDAQAHELAVDALDTVLGDLVLRPPAGSGDGVCADAPMEASRQDVLDAGRQVVVVGNCGPGSWGAWVHERGPLWQESSHDGSYPGPETCAESVRTTGAYDTNFIRHWEDLTWLSAMASGATHPLTPEVTASMVRCGVDMIGFDELGPDDGRLEALIWSWAVDEPVIDAEWACAERREDGRFRMSDCTRELPYSCRIANGDWVVPERRGAWDQGDAVCAAVGGTFAVPPTGWENQRLGVAAGPAPVWLPLGIADVGGAPAAPPAPPSPTPAVPTGEATLPATGGTNWLVPGLLGLVAATLLGRRPGVTSRGA